MQLEDLYVNCGVDWCFVGRRVASQQYPIVWPLDYTGFQAEQRSGYVWKVYTRSGEVGQHRLIVVCDTHHEVLWGFAGQQVQEEVNDDERTAAYFARYGR